MSNEQAFNGFDSGYENDDDTIVESRPSAKLRPKRRTWLARNNDIGCGLTGLLLAGTTVVVVSVIGATYLLFLHFMWLTTLFALAVGTLPFLGVGYIVLELHSRYKRTIITPIHPGGMFIQDRWGNARVISPVELQAFEIWNRQAKALLLPECTDSVHTVREEKYFPERITEDEIGRYTPYPQISRNDPETATETPTETVGETVRETPVQSLQATIERSDAIKQDAQEQITKIRIRKMYEDGATARYASGILRLVGDKYVIFDTFSKELGIVWKDK